MAVGIDRTSSALAVCTERCTPTDTMLEYQFMEQVVLDYMLPVADFLT